MGVNDRGRKTKRVGVSEDQVLRALFSGPTSCVFVRLGEEIDVEEVSSSERIPLMRNVFEGRDNLHDFLASANGGNLLTDDQSAFKKAMLQRYLADSVEVMNTNQDKMRSSCKPEVGSRKRRRSSSQEDGPESKRQKSKPQTVARPQAIGESVNSATVAKAPPFLGFDAERGFLCNPMHRQFYPFLNSIPLPITFPFLPRQSITNPFHYIINNKP